jgi:hypothetical protein
VVPVAKAPTTAHRNERARDTVTRLQNEFIKVVAMEAEQLNAISNQLQDLRGRANELRRYL